MRIRRDMRNEAGGIMVAPLAICVARRLPGRPGRRPEPGDRLRADPRSRIRRPDDRGPSTRGSIHQGRTMGYGRCLIVDADDHDRVIAFIDGQGASIGTPPEGLERMDVDDAKLVIEDSPDLPPLWQVFGASRRDDGHWLLPELSVEFASPDAALHIGPQHVVLETAAVDLAAELAGTRRLQVQSWHVMFLARGKVGPVPGRRYGLRRAGRPGRRAPAASTTRATATAPSRRARPCSRCSRRSPRAVRLECRTHKRWSPVSCDLKPCQVSPNR